MLVALITFINSTCLYTVGCFSSRATNFVNGARKGVCGTCFHKTTLAELFTIHTNLHVMEFLLICGEKILWKSQKSVKSAKFIALKERAPNGTSQLQRNGNCL